MSAAPAVCATPLVQERDGASWEANIAEALATPDPALANLRITAAHYQLSGALHALLGPDSGANFHTWATWGSKKAGQTIRHEEVPQLEALALLIGVALGLLAAVLAPPPSLPARLLAVAVGAALGGWTLQRAVQRCRARASRLILEGNRMVLDDIGRQTARFLSLLQAQAAPDPRRLAAFLDGLRPGPATAGGQDLLRAAFTHYCQARYARSRLERDTQMLLGNLHAILHEHLRLQPYIAGAMPCLARRLITRHLLAVTLGRRVLRVSAEDVLLDGGVCLLSLQNAELRAFLRTWARVGCQGGSRATDWADLRDRMAYICHLFHTGHHAPDLFAAPYTATQWAAIASGHVPAGAL